MSKQVRTKAAPAGHHMTKEDRQKRARLIAAKHQQFSADGFVSCNCGNHKLKGN